MATKSFKKDQIVQVINLNEVKDLKSATVTVRRNTSSCPGLIYNSNVDHHD